MTLVLTTPSNPGVASWEDASTIIPAVAERILVTIAGASVNDVVGLNSVTPGTETPQAVLADADTIGTATLPLFVVDEIVSPSTAYVVGIKVVTGVDTSAAANAGDPVYLSSTAGDWAVVPGPVEVIIGSVLTKNAVTGAVLLDPQGLIGFQTYQARPQGIDMNGAAHTLTYGPAGAGQTQLIGNILQVDPVSAVNQDLTLPDGLLGRGPLVVQNIGLNGGSVTLVDPSGPADIAILFQGDGALIWGANQGGPANWGVTVIRQNLSSHIAFADVEATGGQGGSPTGSMTVSLYNSDLTTSFASIVSLMIVALDNGNEPSEVASVLTTVTFSAATVGSIVASGNGWALVTTAASVDPSFACTVTDSADETVSLRVRASHLETDFVVTNAAVTATWTA